MWRDESVEKEKFKEMRKKQFREGRRQGRIQGRKEGKEIGKKLGEYKLLALYAKLKESGLDKEAELIMDMNNDSLRELFYKEYGLDKEQSDN